MSPLVLNLPLSLLLADSTLEEGKTITQPWSKIYSFHRHNNYDVLIQKEKIELLLKFVGVDYIEYFNLDEDSNVINVNPDAMGSSSSDYHSDPIITSGIPIGVGQDLTTQLYVSLLIVIVSDTSYTYNDGKVNHISLI